MSETLPLRGKRIVVTRASSQSHDLSARLAALGAESIELPVIQIVPPEDGYAALDDAIASLGTYDWLVFSSANAVEHFWQRLSAAGYGADALRSLRIAAVGKATAERIVALGGSVDLVPEHFIAESLLEALRAEGGLHQRFLFPCAADARETLPAGLTAAGGQVSAPHAYRTIAAPLPDSVLAALDEGVDVVTFLSGSAARHFVAQLGVARLDALRAKTLFAAIGPVTAQAMSEAGLPVAIQAAEHSISGLVDAIVEHYHAKRKA